ncbi:hypothetical protein K435DRAFT_878237 [Dendrothele bispora CBS 962.96]|uniref:Uncharacterized protein n=1 Tax=Dendrothele bispora (strain CBS 962.96) TaxID=1314807 RepID=A0A4V4HAW7_DENBC|nr:hypothetical protein K435DRAFT_878237 [Dendrothele bispora CBS 962.96]
MVPATRSARSQETRKTRSQTQATRQRVEFDCIELPVRTNRSRRVRPASTSENEVVGSTLSPGPTTVPALQTDTNRDNPPELGSLSDISDREMQAPEHEGGASSFHSDANRDISPELGPLSDISIREEQASDNVGSGSSIQPVPTLKVSVNNDHPVEIANGAKEAPESEDGGSAPKPLSISGEQASDEVGSASSIQSVPTPNALVNNDHPVEIANGAKEAPENEDGGSAPKPLSISEEQASDSVGSPSSIQSVPTPNALVNNDHPVEIANEAKEAPENEDGGSALRPHPTIPADIAPAIRDAPSETVEACPEGISLTPADAAPENVPFEVVEAEESFNNDHPVIINHPVVTSNEVKDAPENEDGGSALGAHPNPAHAEVEKLLALVANPEEYVTTTHSQSGPNSPCNPPPPLELRATCLTGDVQPEGQVVEVVVDLPVATPSHTDF